MMEQISIQLTTHCNTRKSRLAVRRAANHEEMEMRGRLHVRLTERKIGTIVKWALPCPLCPFSLRSTHTNKKGTILLRIRAPGLVNFLPAVVYHFCLSLPEKFSQPGSHVFAQPCTWISLRVPAYCLPFINGTTRKGSPNHNCDHLYPASSLDITIRSHRLLGWPSTSSSDRPDKRCSTRWVNS